MSELETRSERPSEDGDWLAFEVARRGYVRVGMARGNSGCALVEGRVDGRPVLMILDTGASCTILDLGALEGLGLSGESRATPATGVGGGVPAQQVHVDAFDVGSRSLGAMELGVVDLSPVNERLASIGDGPIHGVLGIDVLRSERSVVDVATEALYLAGPATDGR